MEMLSLIKNFRYMAGYVINDPLGGRFTTLWSIVNQVLSVALPLLAMLLVVMIIYGGFNYMMAQGDPQRIKAAQASLTNAIIGFVIVVFAFFIAQVVNYAVTGTTLF